jgi:Arabinose efflux permease
MALLYIAAGHNFETILLCIVWGIAMMMINLALQIRVLSLAPDATDVAMSLMSGIYNIGIGAGALLGGQISNIMGLSVIGYSGAAIGVISLLLCAWGLKRYPALRSNQ